MRLMLRPRSSRTSSALCIENGMIFVPLQWCRSVASSRNASWSVTARRTSSGPGSGIAPAIAAAIHRAAISALSGLKNEEL